MAFSLEQFFASRHLGIFRISDLEPRHLLRLGDVWAVRKLRHDALHVQLADTFEQRCSLALDMVRISQPR